MDSKWSNVSSVGPQLAFMLSVSAVPPIFLYSDLYLNTAYAAHYIYSTFETFIGGLRMYFAN